MSNIPEDKKDFKTRISEFESYFRGKLKELELDMRVAIDFPVYRILPEEVNLALKVLQKHQSNFKFEYQDKAKVGGKEE